ncbi:MAG TPA: TetR/AcrR family transcriptional regulator [Syntrophobacteraceae bacterium]|nr:TetR/AcrR family transcriptional regulator [Syntrophobacteraceae bacterium]
MNLKEKIILEACRLFSLKGYMSTSIQDVMAASGASKGGLYNHFKSKEELFRAVLDHARTVWREKNLVGLDRIDSPMGKLIRLVENYRDNYLLDAESFPGGCFFINLSVDLDDQDPALAVELERGFTGLRGMILRLLEESKRMGELKEGVYVNDVGEVVFASIMGAAVAFGQEKSRVRLNRTITAILNYLKGLLR